ncbi:hypothetical protein SAMN05428966_12616 [Massilia sp. PDC64]|nr:hypothetical protein [Massilia sp. PDC64]SDF85474.1 hypothetical protein SAMN05428966_12616 [Massilia sp. PDC64]
MTNLPQGVQIYLLSALGTALLAHAAVKRYVVAAVAAGVASPFVFMVVCALHGEAVPPMEVPVHVLFTVIAFIIALVAGIPFLFRRRGRGRGA